jgi:nitroreductase
MAATLARMEFTEVVRARRMVRTYQPDRPVPPGVLRRALEHALRAPSAGFSQGWDFLVLTAPEDRELFWRLATDPDAPPDRWLTGMRTAPALVLCLADPERYRRRYAEPDKQRVPGEHRWPVPYWDVDTGMAALLMLLTGVDEGLGGCFFGLPADRWPAVLDGFGVPPDRRVTGVVSLGYPAPDRRSPSLRRGRRPLSEVAHHGRFSHPFEE